MMKVVAISSPTDARGLLSRSQSQGYITFIYHHVDPAHTLVRDKFLYISSDEELMEKLTLLREDVTARDLILK